VDDVGLVAARLLDRDDLAAAAAELRPHAAAGGVVAEPALVALNEQSHGT
jgi:hypothetical protein